MARYSLPWLLLVGVIMTGFAVFLEATMLHPWADAMLGTSAWQTSSNQYAAQGKGMIEGYVRNLLVIIILGIWFGTFLLARRVA